jgi:hypothetical protein
VTSAVALGADGLNWEDLVHLRVSRSRNLVAVVGVAITISLSLVGLPPASGSNAHAIPMVTTAGLAKSARSSVNILLTAVAANSWTRGKARMITGHEATVAWRALRTQSLALGALPTSPPSDGGPWQTAGAPWAVASSASCYGAYCAVYVTANVHSSDGPYVTVYVKRVGTRSLVVGIREDGGQSAIDYSHAYWACARRTTSLSNAVDAGSAFTGSHVVLPRRSLVKVGAYYMQRPSDPTRAVLFMHVVQGYVATRYLRSVPSSVKSQSKAATWCAVHA